MQTRYIYNGRIDFTIDDLPSELGDLNTPHKGGGGSRRSRRSRSSNSRFRQEIIKSSKLEENKKLERREQPRVNQDTKVMVSTNLTEEKLIEGRRVAKRARKTAPVVEGLQSHKPNDVELEK